MLYGLVNVPSIPSKQIFRIMGFFFAASASQDVLATNQFQMLCAFKKEQSYCSRGKEVPDLPFPSCIGLIDGWREGLYPPNSSKVAKYLSRGWDSWLQYGFWALSFFFSFLELLIDSIWFNLRVAVLAEKHWIRGLHVCTQPARPPRSWHKSYFKYL